VDDKDDGDDMLILIHTIYHTPIAHPITPIPLQRASQSFDVRMFVRIAP